MDDQLLDTWEIHHRILLYLLDAITPEGLKGTPADMKGRSVGQILAHMHNVRLMWLETSSPALLDGLAKIPVKSKADKEAITGEVLRKALEESHEALAALFRQGIAQGKIKDCRPHLVGCFGYFLAHEWYHVGEICMTLAQAGHRLDDRVLYGIWEWGRR